MRPPPRPGDRRLPGWGWLERVWFWWAAITPDQAWAAVAWVWIGFCLGATVGKALIP